MSDAIVFQAVGKDFEKRGVKNTVINNLSVSINQGDYVCILGRSGCGKSTLINLLLGLIRPDRGSIQVFGKDPAKDFKSLKGAIGCVFQGDRLLPWRSALDNVLLPGEILNIDRASCRERSADLLERFGLAGYEHARPSELSGGMRQRVAIARALVSDPNIILADEAFAHLDEATGQQLRSEFRKTAKESGKTVVHVTHSIDEALNLSDEIILLSKPGRVINIYDNRSVEKGNLRERILADLNLVSAPSLSPAAVCD